MFFSHITGEFYMGRDYEVEEVLVAISILQFLVVEIEVGFIIV